MDEKAKEAAEAIEAFRPEPPVIGLILGSGLGSYAEGFRRRTVIPFEKIPHFPGTTTPGHAGQVVLGLAGGVPAVALQGRIHCYEGLSMPDVAFPVRVLGALGVRLLVVTNSAGGIHPDFSPGDLMLLRDHINLMGGNPLIGAGDLGPGDRFPDMSETYDGGMRRAILEAAREEGIDLREGIYIALAGPSYETPAEIRMCRILGADAVGMSTVQEVIMAKRIGMKVLGISCITNPAAGLDRRPLRHDEVLATAGKANEKLSRLLNRALPRLVKQLSS